MRDYIFYILQKTVKKYIGDYFHKSPNKLFYLSIANSVGLKIPETFITSVKSKMKDQYLKCNESLITKAISESYGEINQNLLSYSYTTKVYLEMINSSPDTFFPSLVQKHINKFVEIRIFFIEELFFSMAMFYSNDETDYRDDYSKIKIMTPFNLPKKLESKILSFIKKTHLTTGSIDIMMGSDYQFYFLEVNPNGQFGFVSDSCNYYIEKKIIEVLIK